MSTRVCSVLTAQRAAAAENHHHASDATAAGVCQPECGLSLFLERTLWGPFKLLRTPCPWPMGPSNSPLVHGGLLPALVDLNRFGESGQPGLR
eukprot:1953039-Rhodomonas_salina.4